MTTTSSPMTYDPVPEQHADAPPIPLGRVVRVELRKMFDTRSGFWLVASIVIAAVLATVITVLVAPDADLNYYTFAEAVGFPMTIVLPMIAALAITGEWSQRTGLTTFTLNPHRGRVIRAKVAASVLVAVTSMALAFVIGAFGNVVGSAVAGTDQVWNVELGHGVAIVVANLVGLLTGTMLGMVMRNSPAALVSYFVYALVLPTLSGVLAGAQQWYADVQSWVDLNLAQGVFFQGTPDAEQWAHLASAAGIWVVLPGILGLRLVLRSEVK